MSRWNVVSSCLVLSLLGCDGSGGDGDGTPMSVDRNKAVDELSAAEHDALCAEQNGMVQADAEYHEQFCIIQGVAAAESGASTCEAGHDACLDAPVTLCDPAANDDEPFGCPQLTVGIYMDCLAHVQELAKVVQQDVSCESTLDEITDRGLDALDQLEANPTGACKKMFEVCPTVFD